MLLHSSIIFINTWRSWSTLKLLYEMSVRSLQLTPALGVSSAVRGCGFAPREKAGNPFGNAEVDFRPRKCLQKRWKSFRTTMSVIFLVKSPSATVQHSISLPPAYLQHSRAKPSYLWGCLVVSLILSGVNQSVHKQVTHSGCPKHSWSNWRQAKTSVLTCWPQRNKHWPFNRGVLCVCVFCDVLPTGPESRTNPRLLKKQLMFCTIAMTERRALSTAPDTGVSQCLSSWLPPSDKNEMKEYENLWKTYTVVLVNPCWLLRFSMVWTSVLLFCCFGVIPFALYNAATSWRKNWLSWKMGGMFLCSLVRSLYKCRITLPEGI